MSPPDALLAEEDDAPHGERRTGVTMRQGTAVTLSVAFLLQAGYMVFTLGRTAEKLDGVVSDVAEIKRAQYTRVDAERDLAPLRREDEKIGVQIRDLQQSIARRVDRGDLDRGAVDRRLIR